MSNTTLNLGRTRNNNGTEPQEVKINIDRVGKDNLSMLFLGASGSGKTTVAQNLMLQIAENTENIVFAIDLNGTLCPGQIFGPFRQSFEAICNRFDGYVNPIPCHLLTPCTFSDGTVEKNSDLAACITDPIATAMRFGPMQIAELSSAIENVIASNAYASAGFSAIDHALKESDGKSAETARTRLHNLFAHDPFKDGELFLEPHKINILDLSKYDTSNKRIISEILLHHLFRLSQCGKLRSTFICLDEFQNIGLRKEGILSRILAEGRKFSLNTILVTQSLDIHFNGSEQKLLGQSRFKFFFRPSESDAGSIASLVDVRRSTDVVRALRRLKTGEFLVTGPTLINGSTPQDSDYFAVASSFPGMLPMRIKRPAAPQVAEG